MAKYSILNQEVDMANKIRVWVDTGNGVQMLKFHQEPTKTELKNEVNKLINNKPTKEDELKEINRQITILEEQRKRLKEELK